MNYRVEIGDVNDFRTKYADDRGAALAMARKLSRNDELAYVVGFDSDGDVGQIVYANGRQSGADGLPI